MNTMLFDQRARNAKNAGFLCMLSRSATLEARIDEVTARSCQVAKWAMTFFLGITPELFALPK
jgi:hypothetical protein